MRSILLLMCVITLSAIGGCHGASTESVHPVVLTESFSGLAGPAALLAMDTGPHGGKQASFYTEFEGHQWDPALPHSDNILAVPDYSHAEMDGRRTPLTYCIYRVAPNIIAEGVAVNSIYVACSYLGETPAGTDGLYIGFADFTANRWLWLERLDGTATLNLDGLSLAGNDGPEYIVAVNYSEYPVDVLEIAINYEGALPGTSWIYYTQAPVFPGEPRGIARVPVTGISLPETIRTGIMLTGYRSPKVRYMPGGDRLYYTREEGGAGIYWCNMDGSGGENDHRTYEPSMQLLDWDMGGDIELYIEGYGTEAVAAWWYDWDTSGGGKITPSNGYIIDGHIDSFHTGHDYAVYLALAQPAPAANSGLYWFGCDTWPWSDTAEERADNDCENIKGLVYSRYVYASGEYREGCFFISDNRNPYQPADTSENIYFSRVPDNMYRTYLVDPSHDFGGIVFSPDGRWAAIAVKEPADPYYDIYITPASYQYNWAAYPPIAEDDCWGDLEWYYDSTP